MITLITSFLTFLMTLNVPSKTECQNRLQELNYTYEYNQEPAHQRNGRYSAYSRNRPIEDTIPYKIQQEILSTYSCFRQVLEADTNQVLLISRNPVAKPVFRKDIVIDEESKHNYSIRLRNIGRIIHYHHLEKYNVYHTIDSFQSQLMKVELLKLDDSKLNDKNIVLYEECKNCPF